MTRHIFADRPSLYAHACQRAPTPVNYRRLADYKIAQRKADRLFYVLNGYNSDRLTWATIKSEIRRIA